MQKTFWQHHHKFIKGLLATIILMIVVGLLQSQTTDFMATLLNVEKPEPFDGTSLPIKEVPDWTSLSSSQYKLLAAEIPTDKFVELPNYDPAIFGTLVADLNWSTDQDLADKLITYAVPYMGSYESGSKEYEGSHLAVDIKVPTGTAVYAVANGKVVKVAQSSSGFGKHIVIEHPDAPLLDSNETSTLYSAYAHLSEIFVEQGQIVKRGDLIAKSGSTGTSTTPHLHFQIDNSNAPWHPWWPFTSAEAATAGVSFFDGVSAGLGQDEAIVNTINPMLWVQRYLVSDTTGTIDENMHASSENSSGEIVNSEIVASTEDVEISHNNETEIVENTEEETAQTEESDNATEENQEPVASSQEPVFTDVDSTHPNYKAIKYLKENGIVGGYDDGSFKPLQTVNRVEALKMLILGFGVEEKPMLDLGFSDTSNLQWYASYIGTAMNHGIVSGYPDNTFRPGNTINRAEYLKVLLKSAGIDTNDIEENLYGDVASDAWFANFVSYSKTKNIFPIVGNLFEGGEGVTRAEVAETIYRLLVIRATEAESYTTDLDI